MLIRRPIAVLISASLLQACATPVARQATLVQPLFEVRHSDDKDAVTYARLGKYHQERGNLDRARTAYIHSISLDGRQLTARTALAAIDSQQGRLDEAKSMLQDVVADFPNAASPYNNLGYLYYLQGDFSRAVKTLERAVALDGGNDRSRNNLKMAQAAAASQGEMATILRIQPNVASFGKDEMQVPLTKIAAATVPPVAVAYTQVLQQLPDAQSRMEIVQILPNVYELKARTPDAQSTAISPVTQTPSSSKVSTRAPAPLNIASVTVAQIAPLPKAAAPAQIAGPTPVLKIARLEIANGIGVKGIARRVSDMLGKRGITANLLSNQKPFRQQVTEIQYRAGFEKQALALSKVMPGQTFFMRATSLNETTDVRVVLGRDLSTRFVADIGASDSVLLAAK